MPVHEPSLVSVIIPAYNAEKTIGGAIAGALTQTYPAIETIVIDDGSTDGTRAICEGFGDAIRFMSLPNGGTACARNAAVRLARGEYIALCDADDILLPPHVETMLSAYHAAGGGRRFVGGNAYLMTNNGIAHGRKLMSRQFPLGRKQRRVMMQANFFPIFALIPADMMDELNGFRPDCYLEDWDLWLRAVCAGWVAVPQWEPHALYRQGQQSKTTDLHMVYESEAEVLLGLAESADVKLEPYERDYLSRRLKSESPRALVERGEEFLRSGEYEAASRLFDEALELWPDNRKLAIRTHTMRLPGVARFWRWYIGRVDHALARGGAADMKPGASC